MGSNWTQQTRGGSAGDFLLISTPHTHVFLNCCTTPSQCLPTMPQILPLHHSNQNRSPPDRSLASWGLLAGLPAHYWQAQAWLNLLACSISKPPAGQRSAACSASVEGWGCPFSALANCPTRHCQPRSGSWHGSRRKQAEAAACLSAGVRLLGEKDGWTSRPAGMSARREGRRSHLRTIGK